MKSSDLDPDELRDWIGQWLEAGAPRFAFGLSKPEAISRAGALLPKILAGAVSPYQVKLDEEMKDVLYALVYTLKERQEADSARHEAVAIHAFLAGIQWLDDEFGEKDGLLKECRVVAGQRMSPDDDAMKQFDTSHSQREYSDEDLKAIFGERLPVTHSSFLNLWNVSEEEAVGLENELLGWFLRFCRRLGTVPRNPRSVLLAAAAQLARNHKSWKAGPASGDELRGESQED